MRFGLGVPRSRRTFMGNGSGVSRGDRNRNARLKRLRALVPVTNAIVGIDLAGSKQMVVVTDHDSRVIARRTFRCRAWDLGAALDWAAGRAAAHGWAGVTVACEPTGHRWRVLSQLAADRSMPFVCVQPVVTSWSRRTEDLTFDKTDDKDAVLIARLTAQLRCYVPEPADETWARLRHLGTRREQLITEAGSQVQQMRDLLECAWPAVLDTARQPFRSATWVAALSVIAGRDGGDLARTRRLGLQRLEHAVRREVTRRGKHRPCLRIARSVFCRARRSGGGDRAPARRAGARAAAAGGLAAHRRADQPGRAAHGRRAGRARADWPGHLDHEPVGRGRRGDPGGDRRPPPVRHGTRAGQARRAGAPGRLRAGSPAGPGSQGRDGPGCGCRHGGRSGEPSAASRSTGTATST